MKPKRTQLFFGDDGTFVFRKLLIEYGFLVTKKEKDISAGWKHFFRAQYPFAGIKGIPADHVTLGGARDIILDPHGIVAEDEKPKKNRALNDNPWITHVADAAKYRALIKRMGERWLEWFTLVCGGLTVLVVIAMMFRGCSA